MLLLLASVDYLLGMTIQVKGCHDTLFWLGSRPIHCAGSQLNRRKKQLYVQAVWGGGIKKGEKKKEKTEKTESCSMR
jgi:hypothetical protein